MWYELHSPRCLLVQRLGMHVVNMSIRMKVSDIRKSSAWH